MEDSTQNNTLLEYCIIENVENIMCKNLVCNRIGKNNSYEAMMDY
jgi:hypothetical protein